MQTFRPALTLSVALLALAAQAESAEVIATCGASKGWSYYVPGGASPVKESKWTEDSIESGQFQLIRGTEGYDVVSSDATGDTVSAKASGAIITSTRTEAGDIVLLVAYKRSVETYVFWLSLPQPEASYSQAKFASVIPKQSLLVASCSRGSGVQRDE